MWVVHVHVDEYGMYVHVDNKRIESLVPMQAPPNVAFIIQCISIAGEEL